MNRNQPDSAPLTTPVPVGVLIADDQEIVRSLCRQVVESLGYRVFLAESGARALQIMERHHVDIVIADLKMPAMSGIELLEKVKADNPRVEVVIMTGYASVPSAVQAMKLGATDYLTKPFGSDEFKLLIERLAQTLDLKDENRYLRERLRSRHALGRLVGQSQPMQHIFKLIHRVSASRSPVLIMGESGTGKELVARSIHENSPWRDNTFVPVDCGALVPTLIESELFGYVRGAFTGAVHNKQGLLEAADGGTLFLDEVAELPVELQTRLLRAIQEREFKPVGSTRRIPFDARIIAATNRDLEAAIQQGVLRKDLYFRLNVVSVTLPPLRERKVDIPLLADHILQRLATTQGQALGPKPENVRGRPAAQSLLRPQSPLDALALLASGRMRWTLSSDALDCLLAYDWPGNVRELENCLERAVTLGSGPIIRALDLPSDIRSPSRHRATSSDGSVIPLEEMERQAILRALASTGGDKMLAARMLGIGKTTLYRKLRQYQLKA